MSDDTSNQPDPSQTDPIAIESKKQYDLLMADTKVRNTVGLFEFSRYIGLFNEGYVKSLTTNQRYELGREFTTRFSRFHPITIINDNDESDTYTIPAQFCSIPLLNESQEAVDTDVIGRFEVAAESTNQFGSNLESVVAELLRMYREIGGTAKVVEENMNYHEQVAMLNKLANGEKIPDPIVKEKESKEPSMRDML